ncbi:uncharacterized protein V6R79_017499 [Siganus canaliculatus]
MDIEELDYFWVNPVSGKHYEWQLFINQQWLRIDNDDVIESNYCHPGAKGITINTTHGPVYIDFDKLQTQRGPAQRVQRLTSLPRGEVETIAWYYRDDQLWREYGSQNSDKSVCSIRSRDVERHFTIDPQGSFNFTVGSTRYKLDFSTMTQTNLNSGIHRNVRRRPTIPSSSEETTSPPRTTGPQWQFQDNDGTWKNYSSRNNQCSMSSQDIELKYQQNPSGTVIFDTRKFRYELDFSTMTQKNLSTTTTRRVQRLDK